MLEFREICWAQGICFRDYGYEVDSGAQTFHNLDVKRFKCMTSGSDEVKAGMDSEINLIGSLGLLFLEHVRFMLVIKKFDDRHP